MGSVTLCQSSASLLLNSRNKMPKGGGSGRSATGGGTNSSGNSYTSYSNSSGQPAGYSYSNSNGSSYYNNGGGHGFYTSPSEGTKSSGGQLNSGLLHPLQLQLWHLLIEDQVVKEE